MLEPLDAKVGEPDAIADLERAGLDILTDGQMWFDDYQMGIGSFLWYWFERIHGFAQDVTAGHASVDGVPTVVMGKSNPVQDFNASPWYFVNPAKLTASALLFEGTDVVVGKEALKALATDGDGNLDLAVGFEGMFRLPDDRPPLLRMHEVQTKGAKISTLTMGEGPDVLLIHGLGYARSFDEARELVESGAYDIGFYLRGIPVKQIQEIAAAGVNMPPKSTYFFPKIPTGLLFNPLDAE